MSKPEEPARPDVEIWNDTWLDRLRERVSELHIRPYVAGIILVVLIGAGGFWSMRSRANASIPEQALAVEPTSTTVPKLLVHVAGAVAKPGVIEVSSGDRVIDAIEKSGGALQDATLDALNLAAKLVDGQRVYVPRAGEQVALANDEDNSVGTGGVLNLNTATKDQLEELPGVGPSLADAIITQRDKVGGFKSVDDLRGVRGIGEKRFEELKDLVGI